MRKLGDDHPAVRVYGILLHRHLEAARKDFGGKRRAELFEFIERFRSEFPDECQEWDVRYTPKEPPHEA